MFVITDGEGEGWKAGVNKSSRLKTTAVTIPEFVYNSATNKQAFIVISDFVNITTVDTEHAFLYMKNDTLENIHIHSIRTCGLDAQLWKIYRNPTAGTIITDANPAVKQNINFGVVSVPNVITYVGGNGSTITDGEFFENWINAKGHSEEYFGGSVILEQQSSMVLTVQCPAPTTLCARIIAYQQAAGEQ